MVSIQIFLMFMTIAIPFVIVFYARLIAPLKLRLGWRIFWGFIIAAFVLMSGAAVPLTLRVAKYPNIFEEYKLGVWLPWVYYIITFLCLLLIGVVLCDIAVYFFKFIKWLSVRRAASLEKKENKDNKAEKEKAAQTAQSENSAGLTRRQFLSYGRSVALAAGAAALTPAAVYYSKTRRTVRQFDISLEAIPAGLDGLRIVHLSDIHVGNTITKEDIAGIVRETNALDPDLIVITGDMADGLPELIGGDLDPMKSFRASYGVFFVTGNHDHLWDGEGWCRCIRELGITVLDNAHEILDIHGTPMAVAGVIDARGDRKNRAWQSRPDKALSGIRPDIFKLMLVHQPVSADPCLERGADLVLAGHTHGGQFWPASLLINRLHKYAHGLYYVGNKGVFVSCGTGYWGPPLRFGVPPEIDVLTLRHKKS